ncbi:unnamed protein product [Peronospora destructor]|uniref:Calcineurin-like phosphoesterase domain-containing protein n=1 Tax=Peronospora destructor TaxID=86335 RepID=A0AAV0V2W2_9STRA|nr:unnamed protein product [Peronospora destructor]
MEATFESVYDQPGLEGIPRINVVGNHDLGGSEYICGDKDYNFRECESTEELLKYLNLTLSLQTEVQERQQRPLETVGPLLRGKRREEWRCYGYMSKQKLSEAEFKKLRATCNDRIPRDELYAGGNTEMCQNDQEMSEMSGMPLEVAEKYVEHAWIAAGNPHGFFMLHFLGGMEFVTFNKSELLALKKKKLSRATGHCWHIPVTIGADKECIVSKNRV